MAPAVLDEFGVGPVSAAQTIISWSHSGRFRNEAAFAVLDRSLERAGAHLRATFEMPDHSLSAHQLAHYLDQEHVFVVLATTTRRHEPRAAPVDSVFYRARFHVPSSMRCGYVMCGSGPLSA